MRLPFDSRLGQFLLTLGYLQLRKKKSLEELGAVPGPVGTSGKHLAQKLGN
jgi:hypothetical protein